MPLHNIRTDFLPAEPVELELTVIELEDGDSALAVALRPGFAGQSDEVTDITEHGAWRRYRGLPYPSDAATS